MKILVDMNLTPRWCEVLCSSGYEAVHWSNVGGPCTPDTEIMEWAATNGYLVFTHDLDFGALLAATGRHKPSVIQVRTEDVMPAQLSEIVLAMLREHRTALQDGALVVLDEWRSRVRILPIRE